MGPRGLVKDFLKLKHKQCVFTRRNVVQLQCALDVSDLISLVFLMCGNDQIGEMFEFLTSVQAGTPSLNLYDVFKKFPDWNRKLPEALYRIGNKLALLKLNITSKDSEYSIKNSNFWLSPPRAVLYRIADDLLQDDFQKLVAILVDQGAPLPGTPLPQLELYFMYWDLKGFLNIEKQYNFDLIAKSLLFIGKPYLADYLAVKPETLYVNSTFDDEYPLELYPINTPSKPGVCVIVNQVKYGGRQYDRDSSAVNVNNLHAVMTALNFDVVTLENVITAEFCEVIKTTIAQSFSGVHSIFILVIMAHGEPGCIICPNEIISNEPQRKTYFNMTKIDRLTNQCEHLGIVQIKDIQNTLFECEKLHSIPKVLVVNACRGVYEFSAKKYFKMEADDPNKKPLLTYVDIITCYSALPNFVSWRDSERGSIFINLLCDVLKNRPDMEITELLRLVNARLMKPTPAMSKAFTPGRKGFVHCLACPFDFTSSLRKKLYFKMPD